VDSRVLAQHLRFYQELGVAGISRDPDWRRRTSFRLKPSLDDARDGPEPVEGPEATQEHVDSPWLPASAGRLPPAPEEGAQPAAIPVQILRSPEALAAIRHELGDCTRCKLHAQGRKQIVFGVGNPAADIMFVGEAPGADEDTQGVPFVGRAGQLLTKMIEAMGLSRDDVYIANVLKCRPPNNRDPQPDEVETCEPFLFQQIASVQPKVVIALGAFAARALLKTQDPISRMRGRVYKYRGADLIPTFHPSFLLRSPGYKREAWEDLKKALGILGLQPPASPPAASRD
jgi:uracil-DNA glycosylase